MGLLNLFVRNVEIDDLKMQIKGLKTEKHKLNEELENLKLKKRLEQEEIKHMTRINEERMKQELETEKIELNKKYTRDIADFKEEQRKELVASLKEFHTKIEARFGDELKNLKEVYGLLMQRLPNVNLTLEKRLK